MFADQEAVPEWHALKHVHPELSLGKADSQVTPLAVFPAVTVLRNRGPARISTA